MKGSVVEKNDSEKRIDFKSGVPDLLYRQAGARCSVPRCTNPTMGPYYANEGAVNMGVASHIYSAAENGPRGWGGKDEAFISSVANGIWCCQYHSVLIDKNKGKDYPAPTLFAWKELAEARVRKQMNDSPSPLGWVESIEFTKFVRHLTALRIDLSRCTLLWAKNGAGKSSLIEITASISNARHAERFSESSTLDASGNKSPASFSAQVTYSTVDALSKVIHLDISERRLVRREGATLCLLPPGDLEIIYCNDESRSRVVNEDDLEFLLRVLDLDKSALLALASWSKGVLMPGEFEFKQADEDTDDYDENVIPPKKYKADGKPYMELMFKKYPRDFFVSYAGLSTSEQDRIVLDLFIAKAREVAKQRLTLVLIDDLAHSLDEKNFARLLGALASETFQSLLTLPPRLEKNFLELPGDQPQLKEMQELHGWKLETLPQPEHSMA